jgi:hypothetical protein
MTSRRSLPRPSSGSRAAAVLAALALAGGLAAAASPASLTDTRDGVEIDWAVGTLTAPGGSAADLRMPSADVARAGAVRRAEATARTLLGRVLADLPLGGGRKLTDAQVTRAVGRARASRTEYQSNGGALVWLTARFGDWDDPAPEGAATPAIVLNVPSAHLAAAPVVRLGDGKDAQEASPGAAVYRTGEPPRDVAALAAKVDRAGRLVVDKGRGAELARRLARGTAVIYVGKVLK